MNCHTIFFVRSSLTAVIISSTIAIWSVINLLRIEIGNSLQESSVNNNDGKKQSFPPPIQLPTTNFLVTVMPMRIGGGSGAPARIIAELPDEYDALASASTRLNARLSLPLVVVAVMGPLLRHVFRE